MSDAVEATPNGCLGLCCAAFYLPHTLDTVRAGRDPSNGKHLREAAQIGAMVVELTPEEARERHERFGGQVAADRFRDEDAGHHFTCRNWDEATRRCRIYDERPAMCADFPYGRACQYGGDACTCADAHPTETPDG